MNIETSSKAYTRLIRSLFIFTIFSLSLVTVSAQTEAGIVYRKASKAVVLIKTDKRSGTGFLVSANGLIATSYHVVEGVTRVSVRTSSGYVFDTVSLVAKDERRDLAILKIQGFDLPFVSLGNSNDIDPGDKIIVIGNPLGTEQLQSSVTDGIVSGVRDLEGYKVIQMTAPVSPGNSGGPAFTANGDAIGVVVFRLREGENLNFAVPINYIRGMLDSADPAKAIVQWADAANRESGTSEGSAEKASKWRTTTGDRVATLRFDGDKIYMEAVSPDRAAELDIKMKAELKKEGTKYAGSADSVITWTRINLVSGGKNAADACSITDPIEITSVTPTRIEEREFIAPNDAKLDKKNCTFSKPQGWKNFVWIPE